MFSSSFLKTNNKQSTILNNKSNIIFGLCSRNISFKDIPRISPRALVFQISKGLAPQILDVRPNEEYKKMRVSGALSYPVATIEQRAVKLNKEKSTFVHCDKTSHVEPEGNEIPSDSLKAALILVNILEFKDVSVIDGSVNELKSAGFFYHAGNTETATPPKTS